VVEHNKPERERKEPEREGPYTKLIAFLTVVLVVLTYFGLAYAIHWPPFKSPNPGPSPSPSATGVPADYQGTWQGNYTAANTAYRISMTLGPGADGTQVGEFTNFNLGCQSAVYLEGGKGPIFLRLVLTSNNNLNQCASSYARATLTSSGDLDLAVGPRSYFSPTEPPYNVIPGTAVLTQTS
jgi:hypothetical protein